MRCEECGIVIPYNKAPDLKVCAICRVPLTPDVRDIFDFGKFDLVKEKRDSQITLAKDIERVLREEKGTLLAEGGTGIGKSFAYLIPALIRNDKRVVIATAKKTLQDQLFDKDLPYLVKGMEVDRKYTIYKGKGNYACWRLQKEVPDHDRKRYLDFIMQARVNRRPADIAKWSGERPKWWSRVDIGNCVMGKNCPHINECKPRPQDASVIVTNHHLAALDMKLGIGTLLGPYNLLIVDEAHQAPEAFRSVHTSAVTFKGLDILRNLFVNNEHLRELVNDSGATTAVTVVEMLDNIVEAYLAYHTKMADATDNIGVVDLNYAQQHNADLLIHTELFHTTMNKIYDAAQHMINDSSEGYSEEFETVASRSQDELFSLTRKIKQLHSRSGNVLEFLYQINSSQLSAGQAANTYLLTRNSDGLKIEPVKIGPIIGPNIRTINHKLIVSATLAMGKDFSHTVEDFGLDREQDVVEEKIYPSAFDLSKQAVLYLPRHIPVPARINQPERPDWISAISREIVQLARLTNGDAFVLFSARADMQDVIAKTEHALHSHGLHLVVQDGEATATQNDYMEHDRSVLYGLKSFWEGVDIAGDKLKLVIIPKLPFPNPKDPLVSELSKHAGDSAFFQVMIPKMTADMRQGVGRLIRTQKDRGFVAILDSRVWTGTGNADKHATRMREIDADPNKKRKGYGRQLLNALGYKSITDDFTILESFVKKFFNTP